MACTVCTSVRPRSQIARGGRRCSVPDHVVCHRARRDRHSASRVRIDASRPPSARLTNLLLSLRTVQARPTLLALLWAERPAQSRRSLQVPPAQAFLSTGATLAMVLAMTSARCPQCGKTGLIRSEHVIKGEDSATSFFCGGCSFSWEEPEVAATIAGTTESDRPRRTLDAR
jgi:predicted RNA-binding Zn-ribbon protein involved in translation (DUF1610 family)